MFGANSSAFGTSGFGDKSSSGNAFANQSNPFATSSTNSGFGGFGAFKNTGASSNASSQQSGFGGFGAKSDAPSQLSAFGSTGLGNTTNTTSGFGSSGFGSTGFAKSTPPSNSGFGSSGFGAKSNPTASAFGQSGFGSSGFLQTNTSNSSSLPFGQMGTQINHHHLEQQPHNLLPLDLQQLSHLITNLHHSVKLTHQIHLLFQIQLQPPRQPTLHLHLDHLTIILQTLLVANLQQARHLGKYKHLLLHLVPAIKPNLHLERHQLKIQIWDLGQTIQHRLSRTLIRIRQLPTMPTHLDQHLRLHLPSRSYQLNLNPSHKLKLPGV